MANNPARAVVIGAGLSGLAAARALKESGIAVSILDQSSCVGDSWLRRHPQLRLNTHRALSGLPGLEMPKSDGAFPTRDTVVRYLQDYARFIDVPIELGVRVERIAAAADGWRLETDSGIRTADHVIVATGHVRQPVIPEWPGLEDYAGRLIHAADFGDLSQYTGKSVLVVGAGNSGTDVLNHLATIQTGPIWVSVRHGPTFMPTRLFGLSVQRMSPFMERLPLSFLDKALAVTERIAFGNLRRFGLREPATGAATRLLGEGVAPAIDNGFIAALKAGRASIVPEVAALQDRAVRLADGRLVEPDVVICATGYRTGLETLMGNLDVLDERGVPRIPGGEPDPRYPGLWFVGMQPDLGGMFRVATKESGKIASAISAPFGDAVTTKPFNAFSSAMTRG